MFRKSLNRFLSKDVGQSLHASVLSRLEKLRAHDFQYDPLLKSAKNREKALMLASCQNRAKLLRLLLSTGSDANTCLEHGETPLMAAATWGSTDVAKVLLDAGANPDFVDEEGMTALDMAIQMAHGDIAELLRDGGAHCAQDLAE